MKTFFQQKTKAEKQRIIKNFKKKTIGIHNKDFNLLGAKKLAKAVLRKTLVDYKRELKNGVTDGEAKRWIDEKSKEVMGFYWCLEIGCINPNAVRGWIKEVESK